MIADGGTANVSGALLAKNANGAGGSIETSGAHVNAGGANITTGKDGSWLLDPDDLTIDSTLASTIETSLNGGTNVTEQTGNGNSGNGDLTVASNIAWSSGAGLTFSAYRNIGISSGVTISNAGSGNLTLRADNTSTGTGTITFADSTAKIDFSGSTGIVALLYNPSSYASPTSYSANVLTNSSWTAPPNGSVSSQFTAYMLVNNASNLQNIDANDAGTYALGQNIDLSGVSSYSPLGASTAFSGIFDGMGHTLSNLSITDAGSLPNDGLFAQLASSGQIRNLNLTNFSIAETGQSTVGTLVGSSAGTVSNVTASGSITVGTTETYAGGLIGVTTLGTVQNTSANVSVDASQVTSGGLEVGGLIGENAATIINSSAAGSVTSTSASSGINSGGLIGLNLGTIAGSFASGNVTGAAGSDGSSVGGLVGANSGPVSNSYATGTVNGGTNVGGLIGYNAASVTGAYATGNVADTGGGVAVGGLIGYSNAPVSGSHATGTATCGTAGCSVGGLAGQTATGGTIDTSYASGAVIASNSSTFAGGLVGNAADAISNSSASGNVQGGDDSDVGGLAGYMNAAITASNASGSAVVGNPINVASFVGGLVGYADSGSSITNSYASGNTAASASNPTNPNGNSEYAGGLAGYSGGPILNSHATGTSTVGVGSSDAGGLVGASNPGGTITGSYATGAVSGTDTDVVGGLIGTSNDTISNSYATGGVSGGALSSAGGLVGANGAAITGSYATGAVSGLTSSNAGGLVGAANAGSIDSSYATGPVIGGDSSQTGGLAGYNDVSITNSYANGAVTGGVHSTTGGLVGDADASSSIANSHATGSVTIGFTGSAGGLVGFNYGTITTSYAGGAVVGGMSTNDGGLGGDNTGSVSTSYATGSVRADGALVGGLFGYSSGSLTDTYAHGAVNESGLNPGTGGLVGELDTGGSIARSYSTGLVTASGAATGGFAGTQSSGTSITSSYWDSQSSGISTTGVGTGGTGGVTPRTTAQLQSGAMPTGFNASNTVWTAPSGVYPYFGWQGSLVTISGTAYNNANTIASAGVGVISAGDVIGNVSTDVNGFYTISEPQNVIGSSGVLAFLTSGGTANTFSDGGNGYTGMDLHTGTLTINASSNTTMSGINNALATTLGGNTGSNFLFMPPSGQLALNSSTSLVINSAGAAFHIDQPISAATVAIQATGSLTIDSGGTVTSLTGDINLSTGSTFTNNAGWSALNASNTWFVWSQNPVNDNVGGLSPTFIQYDATYGVTTPVDTGDDGFLYAVAPVLNASLSGPVSKTYDGTASAPVTSSNFGSISGVINGDTIQSITAGTANYAAANVNSGISVTASGFSITASNGIIPVYGYQFASPSLSANIGTITPATLTYTANAGSRIYGSSDPAFTGTVTGFVNGETLGSATAGSAMFTSATTPGTNVGSYAINGSGLTANNGNYTFQQASTNSTALTINPATLTYTANAGSRTYGSADPAFSGTVTGFVNGDTLGSATTGSAIFTSATTQGTNVGNYAINGSGLTANFGNYTFQQASTNSSALTINPATLTYAGNAGSRTYGSADPAFTGTVTGFVHGDTLGSATTGSAIFTSATAPGTNVGNYAIDGSGLTANNGNYIFQQASGNATALTINPATLTYTADATSRTYGGTNPSFTGSVTGFVNGDTLGSATTGSAIFSSTAMVGSNVGSYAISGSGLTANNGNYTFQQALSNSTALTINPATLTYTANAGSRIYGSADPAFSGTVTGFVNGDTLGSATTGSAIFTSATMLGTNVGSYAINGSGLAANFGNYTFQQASTNATALTINPATLTYTANAGSRTYGSADPAFTGTVTGFVNGDTLGSATTGSAIFTSATTLGTNVGSYAINGSGLAANFGNYTFQQASTNATALTINPATLTYTAGVTSRTYGSANPSFTGSVTGLVNGDTLATATTGSAVFTSAATAGSNVGNYAVSGSGLTANNGDYIFQQASSNATALTINPATLTYTANPGSRTYGSADPAFSGTVTGFVNGDTLGSVTTGSAIFASATTAGTNIGNYAIDGSGLTANNGNYTFQQASANSTALTINPATLTYTANAVTRTYGSNNPVFTGAVAGFVNGDTVATATSGAAIFSSNTSAGTNVGTYGISGSGLTANYGNYTFQQAAANSTALTINPATLTYIANAVTRTYGSVNPTFTGTVTGFVNGDTQASATTGAVSFASTATSGTNAGSYLITGSGLTANNGNYAFTQAATNAVGLTIDPAILTYTASAANRTYGSANPTFTGTVTGFENGDTLTSSTTGTEIFTSPATAGTNVGSYAINGSGLALNTGNYTFVQAASNATALTINPAILTYNANAASRTYGSINPAFSGTVTGFVNGDTLASATRGAAIYTSTAAAGTNVGNYEVNGSGLTANFGNYVFQQADANAAALTINPAPLTYAITTPTSALTRPFGQPNPAITGTLSGLMGGDSLSSVISGTPAFTTAATPSSAVGSYSIAGSGVTVTDPNYVLFPQTPATLTITPVHISIGSLSITAGQTAPTFAINYSGPTTPYLQQVLSSLKLVSNAPSNSTPGTYQITAVLPPGLAGDIIVDPGTLTIANGNAQAIASLPASMQTSTSTQASNSPLTANATVDGSIIGDNAGSSTTSLANTLTMPSNASGSFQVFIMPSQDWNITFTPGQTTGGVMSYASFTETSPDGKKGQNSSTYVTGAH